LIMAGIFAVLALAQSPAGLYRAAVAGHAAFFGIGAYATGLSP
jgi:hypothetical protein